MKYLPLVFAALARRPLRSALTFLSVAVAFLLFAVLYGITAGFNTLVQSLSDTRVRVQNRVSFTRWMPLSMRPQIESVPGVASVMPYAYFGGYYRDPKDQLGAGSIDVSQLFKVFPEIELPRREWRAMLRDRTGVLVGAELARRYGWKIGERIPVSTPIWQRKDGTYDWSVKIEGIYRFKNPAFTSDELWMNLDYFEQSQAALPNMASQYIVAILKSARTAQVCRAIDALFRNSPTPTLCQSEKARARAQLARIGNIRFMVDTIVGAVLFTLFALTANTMMQSVRERLTELAVLRTIGYGGAVIAALVCLEALALCVSAALCGLLPAMLVFPRVFSHLGLGTGALPMPPAVLAEGLLIAVGLGIVSAVLPVVRALRLDVAVALAAR
jgi:putative ABC transport system permease protein